MSRLADAMERASDDAQAVQRPVARESAPVRARLTEVKEATGPVALAGNQVFPATLPADCTEWTLDPERDGMLTCGKHMLPLPTEQYRRLAAILYHGQTNKGLRVVMVSSAIGGEGKSLTTSNIALTLSQSYKRRVLLIDADLRRPTLSTWFRQPDGDGLNEHLKSGGATPLRISQVAPRLHLVGAGAPDQDPVSSLTSERMRRVIVEGAERFDWVIVDTPPVALLPDAKLISSLADGAVLVIRSGYSPIDLIKRAIEALGREKILGVVFNGAEAQKHGNKAYYGYYGPGKKPKR
jgi:protein-tyrosine kinase